jgi:iron(III) transport system permease protein
MALLLIAALLVLGAAPLVAALTPLLGADGSVWADAFSARVLGLAGRTAVLGVVTGLACAVVGVPVARALARRRGLAGRSLAALLPLPLILPPWIAGLAWARYVRLSGFWGSVALLTASLWPLVTLFALRGLRAAGSAADAAALARGRARALLAVELPLALPSILAGMLLVFVFAITDFGVVDFLSFNVAEPFTVLSCEIFQKWARLESAPQAAVVSLPALLMSLVALALVLVLERGQAGRYRGLSTATAGMSRTGGALGRRLGDAGLLLVTASMVAPVAVLVSWAARNPDPVGAAAAARDDVLRSVLCGLLTGALVALLGVATARLSLRCGPRAELALLALALLPLAAPGVFFAVGEIRLWHAAWNPLSEAIYRSPVLLVLALTGRFLPLGVLAARAQLLRQDRAPWDAARLSGRGPLRRWLAVDLPLLAPATGLACALGYLLSLRELDVVTLVPAGNSTLVHRLYSLVHIASDDTTAVLCLLLMALVLVPAAAARLLGVPGLERRAG